jgi:prolyl-tRNA synthetase
MARRRAFLRGDHQVNETKLLGAIGRGGTAHHAGRRAWRSSSTALPASSDRSASSQRKPLEDGLTVVVDKSLEGRKNLVAGANKLDYHLRNVVPGRDFTWTLSADIRSVNEGEACPQHAHDGLRGQAVVGKAVEVGHIFKLGYKYTESMGARVLDVNGKEVMPIMGSYGIGIERILTAAIEQSNDKNGFWLPASIAPFTVVVTVTNVSDAALAEPAKSWQRSWKPRASTCCWMTETSVPASNSKMRTWWAFPTASTWARRPPAADLLNW